MGSLTGGTNGVADGLTHSAFAVLALVVVGEDVSKEEEREIESGRKRGRAW